MRFFTLFSILFSSLFFIPLTQASTLSTATSVKLLALDGKKVDSSFFSNDDPTLSKGTHQIVVRYINNFRNGDTVESKPYIFDLTVVDDAQISVKKFHNQHQAEQAIKKGLVWRITTDAGTQEISDADTLTGTGFMPYSDIEKLITEYNKQKGIKIAPAATLTATKEATTASASTTTSAIAETKTATDTLATTAATTTTVIAVNETTDTNKTDQLIEIYNSATKAERKAFRLWLIEADMK